MGGGESLFDQGSEKGGELGGCRCEGDEIVGRIRVGAGERGVCFLWLRVTCISFVNATVSPDQ